MINIQLTNNDLMPEIGSECAAGMDLKSSIDHCLMPGDEVSFGTGVRVELPRNTFGLVVPRSSIGKFEGMHVVLKNTAGIIDSDFRGEIQVKLRNIGLKPLTIFRGDRICQLIIVPHLTPQFQIVDTLSATEMGENGWGSSGGVAKT